MYYWIKIVKMGLRKSVSMFLFLRGIRFFFSFASLDELGSIHSSPIFLGEFLQNWYYFFIKYLAE